MTHDQPDFLSFHLGPVQPFIETARTVRDLWTGSFLLSWLTVTAMRAAQKEGATILSPDNTDDRLRNALETDRLPCCPNRFLAACATGRGTAVADACEKACQAEWEKIADTVRDEFEWEVVSKHGAHADGWADDWDNQIKEFFEIRTAVLTWAEAERAGAMPLGIQTPQDGYLPFDVLAVLMDAAKSVRHVPAYAPTVRNGKVPVKCALLGSLEQLGPADFEQARKFWESVTGTTSSRRGTRLGSGDRYCAVALVKRYAWAFFFADLFGADPRDVRFDDMATVAAAVWLQRAGIDPEDYRGGQVGWNGQWLHWQTPDESDDADPCPPDPWGKIVAARRNPKLGWPPTYYAILILDGDDIGQLFRGLRCKAYGRGADRPLKISRKLVTFAVEKIGEIVKRHGGSLIYSGGDDTLILLPTETAQACAGELAAAYSDWMMADANCENTVSAGLAVVHIKEDLRFALQQAREAERASKQAGKNALTLTVCRRSGEHTAVTMAWPRLAAVQAMVDAFRAAESDRWAYKLREEQPVLAGFAGPDPEWKGVDLAPIKKEVGRLLSRRETAPPRDRKDPFRERVESLLADYEVDMRDARRGRSPNQVLDGFVTLCHSASFLARGRDA